MHIAPGAKSTFDPIWGCKGPKNLKIFRGILSAVASNRSRRSARSWLSSFSFQNAPSPMGMVCIYLHTSIFISQWDRDHTLTLPVTYGPVFWNSVFPRIWSFKTKNSFPKIDKTLSKNDWRTPRTPLYGTAPLPPTILKVGAKCLPAVVLDNEYRALRLKSAIKNSQKVRLETCPGFLSNFSFLICHLTVKSNGTSLMWFLFCCDSYLKVD